MQRSQGLLLTKHGLLRQHNLREIRAWTPVEEMTPEIEEGLKNVIRRRFPGLPQEVMEMLVLSPEAVGSKFGTLDWPNVSMIDLTQHPKLPASVLFKLFRFAKAWHKKKSTETVLLLHVKEPLSSTSSGQSTENEPTVLQDDDCVWVFPNIESTSAASVKFNLGTHVCLKCRISLTPTDGSMVCPECKELLSEANIMLTCHTHPGAAFCSGTDDKFEIVHTCFHMTVGDLSEAQASCCLSFCDGRARIPLKLHDLFDLYLDDFDKDCERWLTLNAAKSAVATPVWGKESWGYRGTRWNGVTKAQTRPFCGPLYEDRYDFAEGKFSTVEKKSEEKSESEKEEVEANPVRDAVDAWRAAETLDPAISELIDLAEENAATLIADLISEIASGEEPKARADLVKTLMLWLTPEELNDVVDAVDKEMTSTKDMGLELEMTADDKEVMEALEDIFKVGDDLQQAFGTELEEAEEEEDEKDKGEIKLK